MQENEKQFNNQSELETENPERESKEIILENLTNKDVLKATLCWYENGNTIMNLEKRWGEKRWHLYQENPKKFFRECNDPDISAGGIKSDLSYSGAAEYRFGFKKGGVGSFGNAEAKFYVIFNREERGKLDNVKRKIQFLVNTNDLGDPKESRQANYLLAKKIIQAWQKAGLPACKRFGNLNENEKQEILEIEKDPEKLKKFWSSIQF